MKIKPETRKKKEILSITFFPLSSRIRFNQNSIIRLILKKRPTNVLDLLISQKVRTSLPKQKEHEKLKQKQLGSIHDRA